MAIKRLVLEKFTVFDNLSVDFAKGINILTGVNGTGKTHILKVLYSACRATHVNKTAVDFPAKLANVFRPDDSQLHRLIKRGVAGNAKIRISSYRFDKKSGEKKAPTKPLVLEINAKPQIPAKSQGEKTWHEQSDDLISTFIPAKEILSNARNLINAITVNNVDFDDTYKDIISAAGVNISKKPDSARTKKYLEILQGITSGSVTIKDEKFYLITGNQSALEFQLVAEGIRKIALLWQLIKNGTLEKDSILFWDEPEANINPVHIPVLAEMLLELQRDGVQIFIATHDYFVAKYFEVKCKQNDDVKFFSFYKDAENVLCAGDSSFRDLPRNSILETFIRLYEEEVEKVMQI